MNFDLQGWGTIIIAITTVINLWRGIRNGQIAEEIKAQATGAAVAAVAAVVTHSDQVDARAAATRLATAAVASDIKEIKSATEDLQAVVKANGNNKVKSDDAAPTKLPETG